MTADILPALPDAWALVCGGLAVGLGGTIAWWSRQRRLWATRTARLARECERLNTEIERLEAATDRWARADAANESKSRFLATVTHEIRTPISGILGMAELLAGTTLSREQQTYVTAVKTSGRALTMLIDEILDLSRIEAGRLDLASEPFDLLALIEGTVELMAPRAQGRGLDIAIFVSNAVPQRVTGDALRLGQVLTNLIGNAVKFTEHGGIELRVAPEDGTLRFTVSDTGFGVAPDRQAAIFEAYEQAVEGTQRDEGTGLGLAISKQIVEGMGGALALADRPGGGSAFSFAIALQAVGATSDVPQPNLWGRAVLVVSPSPFFPSATADALRQWGAAVEQAQTVTAATALLRDAARFDTVIVDGALGEQAARSLAAAADAASIGRTILLFTPAERRAFGQALADDFEAWLVKPVRRSSLAERMGDAADLQVRTSAAWPPNGATKRAATRVLLVEDDPVNALVARTSLDRMGLTVVHAPDGTTALGHVDDAHAGSLPFALILLDLCMPGIDGFEVARRIRARERRDGLAPTRIVAVTATLGAMTRRDCDAAGMDDVIRKPLTPAALRHVFDEQTSRVAS